MGGKFRESCPGIRPKSRFFPKESSQITPLPWNSGLELPVPRRIHPKSPFFPKENSQNSLDLSQVVVLLEKNSLEKSEGREEAPGFRRKRDRRGQRPRYSLKIHWEEIPAWEFPAPAPPSGSASDSGRTSENREFRGFFLGILRTLGVAIPVLPRILGNPLGMRRFPRGYPGKRTRNSRS